MRKKKHTVVEQVLVEDYAAEGKSLGRREGKVLFVEGAVPGDVVDLLLTKNKKDWGEGHPIRFHTYSKDRVAPFCQHFGVCGGCQWQMLPYEKQLQYKQQQVWDNLTRIGKIPLPAMQPIIGAAEDKWYRNKLEYTFSTKEFTPQKPPPKWERSPSPALPGGEGEASTQGRLKQGENNNAASQQSGPGAVDHSPTGGAGGGWAFGFHAKGFFDKIVQIQKCWLQPEPTNALRNSIRQWAIEQGYSFYDIRQHRGLLRTMQVRICRTGEVMVNVVFGEDDKPRIEKLLRFVQAAFPEITTLLYTINLKMNDSMYDLEPVVFSGPGYVVETLEDFRFKIGPKSFFQTNTAQAEQLYRITRGFAGLDGSQTVYDLYCGTGSIGLFCSRQARRIIGVEAVEAAVQDARENATLNGINQAQFFSGDVIDVCTDAFFEQQGRPDVLITDPPRAGMHAKLIQKIKEIKAPRVVYVSCNPATQARDLALLQDCYDVTALQPVDMFPHTHHIENVVQLTLKNGAPAL